MATFSTYNPAYPAYPVYPQYPVYQQSYASSISGDAFQPQYPLGSVPVASTYGAVSDAVVDPNLAPQIEAAYEAAAVHRRQPVLRRQVVHVRGNPGQVKQVVRRVPTPTPDVIERVVVVKPHRDVVNVVIERPTTPPPQVQNRTVVERPRAPIVHSQVVRVPPRAYQPLAAAYPPAAYAPAAYAPAAYAPAAYAPAYPSVAAYPSGF